MLTIQNMPQELIDKYKGSGKNWYVGIDSSTQSVKFNILDADTGETIWQWQEVFSEIRYSKYNAPNGWLLEPLKADKDAYYTDPRMIADALDNGMAALAGCFAKYRWDIRNVRGISGAGQQHGLVFLNEDSQRILSYLDPSEPLPDQIVRALAWDKATIWKNKVTKRQQREVNELFGGENKTRKLTGSSAELRFGAPQAAWLYENHPEIYKRTHTVVNIAGFNGALLTGIPVFDECDAAGTNMMDIRRSTWLPQIDRLVPGFTSKLAPIRSTNYTVGRISAYWTAKYGFSPEVTIVNFTGDNPSAMTGQGIIKPGMAAISLGTSFTAYSYVDEAQLEAALKSPIGNVFKEPDGKWMKLVCFQNGADALKRIRNDKIKDDEAIGRLLKEGRTRDVFATVDDWNRAIDDMKWVIFNEFVMSVPAGNEGAMMITQVEDETVMPIPYVVGKLWTYGLNYSTDDRGKVLRAAAEGQIRFLEYVVRKAGLKFTEINLTGGVAKDPIMRQMVADIFKAKVNILQEAGYFPTEAAALGGAIRAAKTDIEARGGKMSVKDAVEKFVRTNNGATAPDPDNVRIYAGQQKIFGRLVEMGMSKQFTRPPRVRSIPRMTVTLAGSDASFIVFRCSFIEGGIRYQMSDIGEAISPNIQIYQ